MNDFLMQTYTIVLPALLGYIVWLLNNRYMRQGEILSYAYENFVEMYEAYHDLGENEMVEKMYEEISELNLKKKGEGR